MSGFFEKVFGNLVGLSANRTILEDGEGNPREYFDLAGDHALIVKSEMTGLTSEIDFLSETYEETVDQYLTQLKKAKSDGDVEMEDNILRRFKDYHKWYQDELSDLRQDLRKTVDQYKSLGQSEIIDLAKASEEQQIKVAEVMSEFKAGKLKSGSGDIVTDREQAIAIALSMAGINKSELDNDDDGQHDDELEKRDVEKAEVSKEHLKDMIEEHERLIQVMESSSKEDDKKELEIQKKELSKYKEQLSNFEKGHHSKDTVRVPAEEELNSNEPKIDNTKHSVGIIVNDPMDPSRILFLKRSEDDDLAPNTWCLPGGGIDENETPVQAAVRELKEESNIGLEPHKLFLRDIIEVENGKKIYYFDSVCDDAFNGPVALLDGESRHYQFMSQYEWEEESLILDLKAHLRKLYGLDAGDRLMKKSEEFEENPFIEKSEIVKALNTLFDAFSNDMLSDGEILAFDEIQKGRPAQMGEIREYGGQKYQKTAQGWKPVGKGKQRKGDQPKVESKGKQQDPDKPSGKKVSMDDHASKTPDHHLERVANDKSKDVKLRNAAKKELENRGKEKEKQSKEKEIRDKVEKPFHKRIQEKAKDWHKNQSSFYKNEQHKPLSEARRSMADLVRDKSRGIVKGLKHEVKEWKEAGTGLSKFFNGNKGQISPDEKKAMKKVALHLAITIGSMIATGGIAGIVKHGAAALGKHLVLHYLEHVGLMTGIHAAIYASETVDLEKAQLENEGMTPHYAIAKLIENIINHIEGGAIPEDDWEKISGAANKDFETTDIDED